MRTAVGHNPASSAAQCSPRSAPPHQHVGPGRHLLPLVVFEQDLAPPPDSTLGTPPRRGPHAKRCARPYLSRRRHPGTLPRDP
jgi:hypothetical protein